MDATAWGPRPFYRVAHSPNSILQVPRALSEGASAVEPDADAHAGKPAEDCVAEASILDCVSLVNDGEWVANREEETR